MKKKIVILGGSGFVGSELSRQLISQGFAVRVLSRSLSKKTENTQDNLEWMVWDTKDPEQLTAALENCFGVINLVGENIGGLWTKSRLARIVTSRIESTRCLVTVLLGMKNPPQFLIQASAVGIYGSRGESELEETSDLGSGFLADLGQKWEGELAPLKNSNTNVVITRLGIVLGAAGGILARLRLPFRLFLGGHPGSGEQWIAWIHISDVAGAMIHIITTGAENAIYNLVAPNSCRARSFYGEFAKALRRPSWLHLPVVLVKLLPGLMGEELLLVSQKVIPRNLQKCNYSFKHPHLQDAFAEILYPKN